jgi:hypothetical protein
MLLSTPMTARIQFIGISNLCAASAIKAANGIAGEDLAERTIAEGSACAEPAISSAEPNMIAAAQIAVLKKMAALYARAPTPYAARPVRNRASGRSEGECGVN